MEKAERQLSDAAIELAEATLHMLQGRTSEHPTLHVKRAYRSDITAHPEERFLQKLMQYRQRKQRLGSEAREERV